MNTSKINIEHTQQDRELRIKSIYNDSVKANLFSIYVTGGGVKVLDWLFTVPGASKSLIEAAVPYSRESLLSFLKLSPEEENAIKFCSEETSMKMAKAAYDKTNQHLLNSNEDDRLKIISTSNIFGVACTAALATDRPKKDSHHRCYISIFSQFGYYNYCVELQKDIRSRAEEDELCSSLILDAVSIQCGNSISASSPLLHIKNDKNSTSSSASDPSITIRYQHIPRPDIIDQIYSKQTKHVLFLPRNEPSDLTINDDYQSIFTKFICLEDIVIPSSTDNRSILYSGSFNPLHEGHVELVMAELKRRPSNQRYPLVIFEISALNPDKPSLEKNEIYKRIQQFNELTNPLFRQYQLPYFAISVTSEPLFWRKSKIFGGMSLLVGADTFARLINPKYYVEKPSNMMESNGIVEMFGALTTIQQNDCQIVVGGRLITSTSTFQTLSSILQSSGWMGGSTSTDTPTIQFPPSMLKMFEEIPEEMFRKDLSSTEIRNRLNLSTKTTK